MKNIFLALSVVGFIAPNTAVAYESWQTGNILLWLDPMATINGMFGNTIATAFVVDLIFVVLSVLVWMYIESKRLGMTRYLMYVALIGLFGLAGPLSLFLHHRERRIASK